MLTDRLQQLGALIDSAIEVIDPVAAERRRQARNRVGSFEAAKQTRVTNVKKSTESGDGLLDRAGRTVRERARWLDENHDVAIGILDVLVNNIVGTGIGVEPQVKTPDGDLHAEMNDLISDLHEDWAEHPEVTFMHDLPSMDRMACLSWLRDGEFMGQMVSGDAKYIDHGTEVPYSVEMLEADFLPMDYNDAAKRIRQGIEKNQWGRPTGFWVYKNHPADSLYGGGVQDYKRIPAGNMAFIRYSRRASQLRGASILVSVINRLGDVKMYEDYERVAAQVAAALTLFIARDTTSECPEYLTGVGTSKSAPLRAIGPGMILDGLPGEKPEVIQSNRPNNQLEVFRKGNLRAAASGTGTGYSSISKDYSGSYSSQRQELVEQSVHYKVARTYFASRWNRPIYQRFVLTAMLSGRLDRYLKEIDQATLTAALYTGVVMPWIDPQKEADALGSMMGLSLTSRSQAIRERGGNPRKVAKQLEADVELFGPLPDPKGAAPAEPDEPDDPGSEPAGPTPTPTKPPPKKRAQKRKPNGHAEQ